MFDFMTEFYAAVAKGDEDSDITAYVHLSDAWLFSPGTEPLEIGFWRGRLTHVHAWSLGSYTPPTRDT